MNWWRWRRWGCRHIFVCRRNMNKLLQRGQMSFRILVVMKERGEGRGWWRWSNERVIL